MDISKINGQTSFKAITITRHMPYEPPRFETVSDEVLTFKKDIVSKLFGFIEEAKPLKEGKNAGNLTFESQDAEQGFWKSLGDLCGITFKESTDKTFTLSPKKLQINNTWFQNKLIKYRNEKGEVLEEFVLDTDNPRGFTIDINDLDKLMQSLRKTSSGTNALDEVA